MRVLRWVPLAVLVLGAVEFAVLIGMINWIGTAPALIGLVLFTLLGGFLLRREGLRGWRRMRDAARSGQPAGDQALYGVAGLLAALLLFIPGYVTAALGLIILIPPVRVLVARQLRKSTERRVPSHVAGDLFGPRHVRMKKGPTTASPPPSPASSSSQSSSSPSSSSSSSDVIEGEIVD